MSGTQRIDKWLWHARFARTRTAAQQLAKSGQIRVNRIRSNSASRLLKPGDVLTVTLGMTIKVVRVQGFAERRGSAMEAQRLYEELEVLTHSRPDADSPSPGAGPRPNVRDRRRLQELKRRDAVE